MGGAELIYTFAKLHNDNTKIKYDETGSFVCRRGIGSNSNC